MDTSALGDDHDIGHTSGPGRLRVGEPRHHLGLARLLQGDDIEEEVFAMGLLDDGDGLLDLGSREGVEGMGGRYAVHCRRHLDRSSGDDRLPELSSLDEVGEEDVMYGGVLHESQVIE